MKHWLIGSVAAAALLAACGGDGKTKAASSATDAAQVGDVTLAGLQLDGGDASKASDALAALSLSESGQGRVNFAGSSTDGANATFNDVAISVTGEGSPLTAGKLAFKGLDMTDEGANFSQMTLSDISIVPDDADEGNVAISEIQLTNPSPELGAWVASLMGEGDPAPFPAFEKLSFDGLSLNGMNISAEGVDELEAFSIGAIDVRELSSQGIGGVVIESFDFKGEADGSPMSLSLGSIGMAGLSENMMTVFSKAFAGGAAGQDPGALTAEIMALIGANPADPGFDSLTLSDFAFDAGGLDFDIPSMKASVTRDNQDRATRSFTEPMKMSLKVDPEGELGSQLAGPLGLMGYDDLNLTMQSDMNMDPDAGTMSYASGRNYIALEDGFKLSYDGTFVGLSDFFKTVAADPQNEQAALAGLASLSMNSFSLSFEDDSIVDRAFKTAAAMQGQDPAALRSQATASVALIPIFAGQAGVDSALAAEFGGALAKFLDESGTLTLDFAPGEAITAADFEEPSALTKDRLGFTASVK